MGNYARIVGGFFGHGIGFLSGSPYQSFNPPGFSDAYDTDRLWNEVLSTYDDNVHKAMFSAGTPGSSDSTHGTNGLVQNHAYVVLEAKEVNVAAGGTQRLIKLRNPWG